jgi:ATP-dependent DNA ligase
MPVGFIPPCLPSSAPQAPSGEEWLHEIKHGGFRVIARKTERRVKLYSRPGNDLTDRFACGDDGITSFDRIHYRRHDATVFIYAFDLIELEGDDLRREPLGVRKAALASLPVSRRDSGSTSTWTTRMVRSSSSTPVSSGSKASCRSAATRYTAPAARQIGSRARTRPRLR